MFTSQAKNIVLTPSGRLHPDPELVIRSFPDGTRYSTGRVYRIDEESFMLKETVVVVGKIPVVVGKKLGKGGYGTVYSGTLLTNGEKVAVKVQPDDFMGTAEREAIVSRYHGIGKRNTSSILGPTKIDGDVYFTLPKADTDFMGWVKKRCLQGKFTVIIEALLDIVKDLQELHFCGKTHMDLKVDNVLMIEDRAYLADFGKVEVCGTIIPSADADPNNHRHCDPYYFKTVSGSDFYTVDHSFDLHSLGELLRWTSSLLARYAILTPGLDHLSRSLCHMIPSSRASLSYVEYQLKVIKLKNNKAV